MSSAEKGSADPEPSDGEDAATEDAVKEDAAPEDAPTADAPTSDAPAEDAAAEDAPAEDAAAEDAAAKDAVSDAQPAPAKETSSPPKTPQRLSGSKCATSPCSPGSPPLDSTFSCTPRSPHLPPLDATFTCPRQTQGASGPGFTSTPRSSAATRLNSTFTCSPQPPHDATFTCYPQDGAGFDASRDLDSCRSVPMDTTFSRSEVHADGVKITYTRALFPDKTIITKETIIPTTQEEAESLHDRAAELLNSTIPLEDALEIDDTEEGCFPQLKPFPIKRTSARKHSENCPGVCGGKCQPDYGAGRPLSAPTGTRHRRLGSQPLASSRILDATSSSHSAGSGKYCGGKTTRSRRETMVGSVRGEEPKRLGQPPKRRNFSPQRRAVSQPMAVLERKVETSRTYIMTPEGAQVVADFTDGDDLSPNRRPPPRPRPLPPDSDFTLPPLPTCLPDEPPTPIEPYYPSSIPPGLNPNQLMEYAMEQIQLPPQIQAEIDARPYKNPNEMLDWAMQEIQLPPEMEENLQAHQQMPADYHFQRAMQDIQLPSPLEEHLQQRLQALPPGELLPMEFGGGPPARPQSPPTTPQRPHISRYGTPMRPVRLNFDDAEDVFSPCSPDPQAYQPPHDLQVPYVPDCAGGAPSETKRQRKTWARRPDPAPMDYMGTADFVGGVQTRGALQELPGWARRAWEENPQPQPPPAMANWREVCEVRPSSLLDCTQAARAPRPRKQWSQKPPPPNTEPMSTYEFTEGGHLDELPSWGRTRIMDDLLSGEPLDEGSWIDVCSEDPSSPCTRASPG